MTRIALTSLAALAAISLAFAAPAAADEVILANSGMDPFEISKQVCVEKGWTETYCLTNDGSSGVILVGDLISMVNTSIEKLRETNRWDSSVTAETVWPVGAMVIMG